MRVYRVVIALVVVAVFGWTLGRIDWQTVLAQLAGARPAPLALAVVLVLVPLGLRSTRARGLLREVGHADIPFSRVAPITVFGFSMSSLTPAGSGDLLRVEALRPWGVAPPLSAAVVVYERLLDLLVMATLLAVALVATWLPAPHAAGVLLVAAGGVALLALLYRRRRLDLGAWIARLPAAPRAWFPEPAAAQVLFEPRVLGRALATTAFVFLTEALRPWLVLMSLGLEPGFFACWAIFTLAWLAGVASLLPLGIGSWETAAVWAFSLYGIGPSEGAAGAVLLRAGVTLPAILLGLLSLVWLRRKAEGQP